MKKIFILLTVISFFNSCEDGTDGRCFVRFQIDPPDCGWTYSDNNPSVPSSMALDTYYPTSSGTFTYSYTDYYCTGGYAYCTNGTYTISKEKGQSWSGVSNGYLTQAKSGQNRYYTFHIDVNTCGMIDYSHRPILPNDSTHCPYSDVFQNELPKSQKSSGVRDVHKKK